jgi:hypothetical protein
MSGAKTALEPTPGLSCCRGNLDKALSVHLRCNVLKLSLVNGAPPRSDVNTNADLGSCSFAAFATPCFIVRDGLYPERYLHIWGRAITPGLLRARTLRAI